MCVKEEHKCVLVHLQTCLCMCIYVYEAVHTCGTHTKHFFPYNLSTVLSILILSENIEEQID